MISVSGVSCAFKMHGLRGVSVHGFMVLASERAGNQVVWEAGRHMYACTSVRMYVCTYVRLYVCTYVRMYVCTYVHMYVCTSVCK